MSSKVWSIGMQKHTKMIQGHVHIRSKDQFNQVGVHMFQHIHILSYIHTILVTPMILLYIFHQAFSGSLGSHFCILLRSQEGEVEMK